MSRDVLIAAVIGAHGLKGEVKVKTFTATPDALARYRTLHAKDGRVFTIAQLRPGKADEAVATLAEVIDRNTRSKVRARIVRQARCIARAG